MRKSDFIGLFLLAFVIGCRFSTPVADFYAERCYPVTSAGLSLCASVAPFSLEEVVVIGFIVALVAVLIRAIRKKEGVLRWLGKTARVAMWLVVWLYLGWANNYFRTPLYPRMGIQRASYEEEAFSRFLTDYTEALNGTAEITASWDREALEADVKEFYSTIVSDFGYTGLRPWQHVKKPLLNPLYSAVGVLGFMGPFLCESQLNLDLPEVEYPFTLAHELAHLAGVTSEAEANYWAYVYCRQSDNPAVRYSGHLGLLPYAATSAGYLLSEDAYAAWTETLSDKAKADYEANHRYWEARRVGIIDRTQRWMMDRFLRSNGVREGAKDYYGVIGMLMTLDDSFGDRPDAWSYVSDPAKRSNPNDPTRTTPPKRPNPKFADRHNLHYTCFYGTLSRSARQFRRAKLHDRPCKGLQGTSRRSANFGLKSTKTGFRRQISFIPQVDQGW